MDNLKERRKAAGLTQAELARRCGCSRNYIWLVKKSKERPSDDMKEKIRRALGEEAIMIRVPTEEGQWRHDLWVEKWE